MSRPGFSEIQKSMCKFVPDFKRRCVRVDPFLCWQNIGAGKYRTSRRLRPFSAQFQTKDDICMAPIRNHLYVKIEEYARNEVRLTFD